jgi:hypothetical protein
LEKSAVRERKSVSWTKNPGGETGKMLDIFPERADGRKNGWLDARNAG